MQDIRHRPDPRRDPRHDPSHDPSPGHDDSPAPRADDERRELASAHQRPARRGKPRVLIIEDNADACESLREVLELNGHQVETAENGLLGIEKAHAFRPDVVLCDLGLPGIDGFEVARRMSSDPALRTTCLVALSGYAAPEDLRKSKAAGFRHHLAKPADIVVLEATLTEACASHPAR